MSHSIHRRTWGVWALMTAAAALCAPGASAQSPFPSKPIKIIVPFAAAGSTDILARTLANALTRELG